LGITLVCGAAVAWLAARGWSARDALDSMLVFVAMALALTVSVLWRFDILPAALTALALVAFAARLPGWAGAGLGFGIATKLYPAFLAPIFLANYVVARKWRSLAVFLFGLVVVVGAIVAQIYLVAGTDALSFLTYQRDRGTEIESMVGGLALAADAFLGIQSRVVFNFGSFNVLSPVIRTLAVPDFVLHVVSTVLLAVVFVRATLRDGRDVGALRPQTVVQLAVATLLLLIIVNKVLSPQYMVWLLPFVPLLAPRPALVFVIASVLTTLVYPLAFDGLRGAEPVVVLTLLARNGLLVVMFVWTLWALWSQRSEVRETSD
jgi:hypothetical protein